MDSIALISVLLAVVSLVFSILLFKKKNIDVYWQKRGIPGVPGALPIFGHVLSIFFGRTTLNKMVSAFYQKYSNSSMIGFFNSTTPALVLRDPELIKVVLQSNFSNFHKNFFEINSKVDPLVSQNPFFSDGDLWVQRRKRFTHAFSTMRLKQLATIAAEISKKFDSFLERTVSNGKVEMEMKDLFCRYTAEMAANAGLNVEGGSFEDEIRSDTLLAIGNNIFKEWNNILFTLAFITPVLNRFFQFSFFSKEADQFFRNLVKQVLNMKKKEGIKGNDFLQLIIDSEKTEDSEEYEETLTSYVVAFFLDTFETSATTMSFVAFELSRNPDVQEKLRKEIESVLAKHDGNITYDSLKDMTYMDQVISESQRLHGVLEIMTKKCTVETELKGWDGLTCRVEPDTQIIIPAANLQTDPKYWQDPETFDPERFNDERKRDITKYTFLPFGEGPRICVGMRLALLQTKAALATLINKYSLEPSAKTTLPLKLVTGTVVVNVDGGLWTHVKAI